MPKVPTPGLCPYCQSPPGKGHPYGCPMLTESRRKNLPPIEHQFRKGCKGGPGRKKKSADRRRVDYWLHRHVTDPRNVRKFFQRFERLWKINPEFWVAAYLKIVERTEGKPKQTVLIEQDPYSLSQAVWQIIQKARREMRERVDHPERFVGKQSVVIEVEPTVSASDKVKRLIGQIQAADEDGDGADSDDDSE